MEYGKVRQFPMDAPLMPLAEQQMSKEFQPLPIDPQYVEEDPQVPEIPPAPYSKPALKE